MEKIAWDGPKWAPRGLFPANPDLVDILGRTDLNFEISDFFVLLDPKFLDFQVPRFPNSQTEAWARPGPTWAGRRTVRDTSATLPDHKVGEIQATRTIP